MLKEASLLIAASKSVAAEREMLEMPHGWRETLTKTLNTLEYWSWEFPPSKTYVNLLLTMAQFPTASEGLQSNDAQPSPL